MCEEESCLESILPIITSAPMEGKKLCVDGEDEVYVRQCSQPKADRFVVDCRTSSRGSLFDLNMRLKSIRSHILDIKGPNALHNCCHIQLMVRRRHISYRELRGTYLALASG